MLLRRFLRERKGGVAPLLALSIVPIIGITGAAIDFSRANASRTSLQAALDSALLYAAKDESANWQQSAASAFSTATIRHAVSPEATFSVDANGNYVGRATAEVPTRVSGLLGKSAIDISATSAVKPASRTDNSCILTLDKGAALSHVSMLFGGAPNIRLQGCATRSNTSMNCNGHSGGAVASIAAGNASGCSNPYSYARTLPDIYERIASNINKECGALAGGATWTPSLLPTSIKMVTKDKYTEFHVCGTLTVSGTGALAGLSTTTDNVIIIENGDLKLSNDASISLTRTTIVFTGDKNLASVIDFPNGNGQSATLSLSPPITDQNPWQGISVYQDPSLTTRASNTWGPGATLKADGVVYMPNSDIEMHGIAASNGYQCSKIVSNSFTTKGSVNLDFSQTSAGCKTINMKQWVDIPTHLIR
jgi:hypothetical protein